MIGEAISHYRILSKLGAGGLGEVYLARDTQLDRTIFSASAFRSLSGRGIGVNRLE